MIAALDLLALWWGRASLAIVAALLAWYVVYVLAFWISMTAFGVMLARRGACRPGYGVLWHLTRGALGNLRDAIRLRPPLMGRVTLRDDGRTLEWAGVFSWKLPAKPGKGGV